MSGRLDFYNYYALALTKTNSHLSSKLCSFFLPLHLFLPYLYLIHFLLWYSQICPILVPSLQITMWHSANSIQCYPFQHFNIICHFMGFSFFSFPPPPFLIFSSLLWEFSTLLLTINPSSSQSCYAAVPGEICEHQAMLIHHQFSERLRNYIFFLPSKYWVSHLFVRLGGQARTRGKQPPKVSPSPHDTMQCFICLGIIYLKHLLWTSELPTSKLWNQEIFTAKTFDEYWSGCLLRSTILHKKNCFAHHSGDDGWG